MIDFSAGIEEHLKALKESLRSEGATDDEIHWLLNDSDSASELYDDVLRDIAAILIDDAAEHLDKRDKKEKNDRRQTRRRFGAIWGEGLAWMRQFHSLSREVCESSQLIAKKFPFIVKNPNTHKALYLLFARAVGVYSEVLCLMENAFPDGAFAHYRTLYELWAVAEFLSHDEDREAVSLAFLEGANKKIPTNEAGHYKWAKVSKRFEDCDNVTINAIVTKAHETCMLKREEGRSNTQLKGDYTFPNILLHPSAVGLEIWSSSFPDAKTVGMANPAINSSFRLYEISSLYSFLFADVLAEDADDIPVGDNAFICNEMLKLILFDKIIPIFNEIEHEGQQGD